MFISPSDTKFILCMITYGSYDSRNRRYNSSAGYDFRDEDWYLDALAKYGDGIYADQFNSNPYLSGNYDMGYSEFIAHNYGARTNFDALIEEQRQNAKEYINQLSGTAQQNAYNSPTNQSDLMRQAGQNPDLLGTGDVAAAAGTPIPDETPATIPPGTSGSDFLSQGAHVISNLVTGILGFSNQILDLSAKGLNVGLLDMQLTKDTDNFVLDYIAGHMPTDLFKDHMSDEDYEVLSNEFNRVVADFPFDKFADSPTARKRLKRAFYSWSDSGTGQPRDLIGTGKAIFEKYNDYVKNRDSASRLTAEPYFNGDFWTQVDGLTGIVTKHFDSLSKLYDASIAQSDASIAQSNYNTEVISGLDAVVESEAVNDSNKATSEYQEWQKEIASTKNELMDYVDQIKDPGLRLACRLLVPTLLSWLSSVRLPSIQRSTTQTTTPTGSYQSSSQSFGF